MRIATANPADVPAVRELFLEYQRWLGLDLCFQGFADELAALPGDYAPPTGALFVGRAPASDDLLGCVALHAYGDPGHCEMKRLYVRDAARGAGLGRRLATTVIDEARRLGYTRMRLDTLPQMTAALTLYASLGFHPIASYRYNPIADAVYLELEL